VQLQQEGQLPKHPSTETEVRVMKCSFRLRAASICALLILMPTAAIAAPTNTPIEQESPGGQLGDLLILFPNAARMAAPTWLKEGIRASYEVASATTQGDNGPDTGGGGAGLMQYDVVAAERRTVAAYVQFYLNLGDGTVQQNLNDASVTSAGMGDFWIHPNALATAAELDIDGLAIYEMPFSAAGEEFDALRLQYEGNDSTRVWVFDRASGLLLFMREEMDLDNASRQLTQMTLAGVRTLKLPWKAGGPAFALAEGDTWEYTGSFSTIISGSPVIPLPLSMRADVIKARPRWTLTTNSSAQSGQNTGSSSGLTGATQLFGGIWLPESALAARPRSAVIDRDPLTGATVRFTRGNGTITITQSGASWSTALVYDADTGLFLGLHKEMQVGIATNVYDLQLVQ
jgi:hypothetical protein